jgi:hypothetical protein
MLVIRQLFWGIKADTSSPYPVPPRLIIGWYSLPLYGSSSLFKKRRGSIYHAINPKWTQINVLPKQCSRELGGCFSVYVWGKWRTVVYGTERGRKVLSDGDVVHDVLCNELRLCPYLMDKTDKERAIDLISQALLHENIIRFSSAFGEIANAYVDRLLAGGFERDSSMKVKGENTTALISLQSLKLFTMALVEGPLFNMTSSPAHSPQQRRRQIHFKQVAGSQEREFLSQMNSIQQRFKGMFQISACRNLSETRALESRACFDKILLDHISQFSAKKDTEYTGPEITSEYELNCSWQCLCCKNTTCLCPAVAPESQQSPKIPNAKRLGSDEPSLLAEIVRVNECNNVSLHNGVIADIARLLWIGMDVGSAWIQMVLLLLQRDGSVYTKIRDEIDSAASLGVQTLFEESTLSGMIHLDALIFEAIRLCPPFCGGLWKVNKTVEMENDGVQIPSCSHVIINATEDPFNLTGAIGKLPQYLGDSYPNQYLHGFHALNGLEVPIMVLQTKVFLVAVVIRCDFPGLNDSNDMHSEKNGCFGCTPGEATIVVEGDTIESNKSTEYISWHECRSWFDKMPFPNSTKKVEVRKRLNKKLFNSKT